MNTFEVTTYEYHELSREAQQRVIMDYQNSGSWYDTANIMVEYAMKDFERFAFDIDMNIRNWQFGYCRVFMDVDAKSLNQPRYITYKNSCYDWVWSTCEAVLMWNKKVPMLKKIWDYYQKTEDELGWYSQAAADAQDEYRNALENTMQEIATAFANWIDGDYDYYSSDEFIHEELQNNDTCVYLEDGRIFSL